MMKTLIIYFSFSGNNKILAINLAEELDADVLPITEPKTRGMFRIMLDMFFNRFPRINDLNIQWELYDHIILMAPIWNYQIAHPMKSFIRKKKRYLKSYSFITLCSGRDRQKEKIEAQLKKLAIHEPKATIEFEIRGLIASQEQDISKYEVSMNDLKKFKEQEEFRTLMKSHLAIKEVLL